MNLTQLKSQLKSGIPEEFYKVKPGQIAVLTPTTGLSGRAISHMGDLFNTFSHFGFAEQINLQILPTDKPELQEAIIGRPECETGCPYNIIVSDDHSLIGFLAAYFNLNSEEFAARLPKLWNPKMRITPEISPLIISINPEDGPANPQPTEPAQFTCPYIDGAGDFGMGMKLVKPAKGSPEERKAYAQQKRKMEKVLRECAILDIELDIDGIKKKVADSLKSNFEYKLELDIDMLKEGSLSICNVCDIYVASGEKYKLKLNAVQKAIYLTFLLYKDGILLLDTYKDFRSISQKIYYQLPDEDKCIKNKNGIMDGGAVDPKVYAGTLRGYTCEIRTEIDRKIPNPMVAQDFAIEGLKKQKYGIANTTPEIIAQIKEAFDL